MKLLLLSLLSAVSLGQECKVQFNEHCSDCAHMVGDVYDASAGFGLPRGISGFKITGPEDCQLMAFDQEDFQGNSRKFTEGDVCNFCAAGWNDQIKSFKLTGEECEVQFNEHCSDCQHMVGETYTRSTASGLPQGISGFKISGPPHEGDTDACVLTVYAEENYGGRSDSFTESVCNICTLPHWNDKMKSFKIGRAGDWTDADEEAKPVKREITECTVTFNEHCSDCFHLFGEEHTQSKSDTLVNGISGFRLEGPADCQLTIFEDEDMQGKSETFTESVCNFCAYSWNDRVKSFNLEGEGCKVQFNEHCSDCGHMFGPTFVEPTAGGLPNGISGWKIMGENCKLTIYEQEGWKGRSAVFMEDVCNLCEHTNWNDKAQSFLLERACDKDDSCEKGDGGDGGDDGGDETGKNEENCSMYNDDAKQCKKTAGCRMNKKQGVCEEDNAGGGGLPPSCDGVEPLDVSGCKKIKSPDQCDDTPGCYLKKNKCKPMKKVKCKKIDTELCCHYPGCKPEGKKCGGEFTGWK